MQVLEGCLLYPSNGWHPCSNDPASCNRAVAAYKGPCQSPLLTPEYWFDILVPKKKQVSIS